MKTQLLSLTLLLSLVALPASAQNLLTNGDFETGTPAPWLFTGSVGVIPRGAYFGADPLPQGGDYFASFNGGNATPDGMISQVFSSLPGYTYTTSFWFGNYMQNATLDTTQKLLVQALDDSSNTVLATFPVSVSNPFPTITAGGVFGATFQFSFTATGANTRLEFIDQTSVSPDDNAFASDGLLDSVSVTAAPEPGTCALAVLGATCLVLRRRKAA